MTIALLTTNLARGGAENQVAQLAMRLRARGWQTHVVSLLAPSAWEQEFAAAGVPVYAPGVAGLPAALRRIRPAILHCHMFHANVLGRVLRLVLPVPVVVSTLHSIAESPRGSERYWPRAFVYRLTQALADRTVAVYDGPWNGVDTEMFRPPAEPSRRDRFTWLAAGRVMWKKDYPSLLAAMRNLPDADLLIAGTGPDEAALRESAPPNVRFLGVRSDLPELMREVDGFVLSSVVEGLPVVLLEAGASGLPVVATDVGGVRMTRPERLVPPRDANALAEAMRAVMRNPPDRRVIRDAIAAEFNWDAVVDRWEALYRELWT